MKLTEEQTARLASLADRDGRLLPSAVLADARLESSPLHNLYTWNRNRAAQFYYEVRTREIIASVRIAVTTTNSIIRAPMYLKDTSVEGEGYRSVIALRDDPVNARASLVYTLEIAAGHVRRAYDVAQPLGLAGEVDAILEQLTGLTRRLRDVA